MNIWERRARVRDWQERRIRQRIAGAVENVCCLICSLAWLSFFGYLVCQAVAEKWR